MSSEIPEEEMMEEAPLSAEELFEAHKAEINAAFEEKGFFRRMADMLKGLSKPHSSPEFKMARVELQRLAAPILAVLLPVISVVVLIIVTEVQGQSERKIEVGKGYDANGVLIYNKRVVKRKELDQNLREVARTSKKTPIIVKCAGDSPHKALVDVLDICYKNGLFSVSIFTL